jgi:hypothetical protein
MRGGSYYVQIWITEDLERLGASVRDDFIAREFIAHCNAKGLVDPEFGSSTRVGEPVSGGGGLTLIEYRAFGTVSVPDTAEPRPPLF